jgi:exopolysaccharide production protein ExoY
LCRTGQAWAPPEPREEESSQSFAYVHGCKLPKEHLNAWFLHRNASGGKHQGFFYNRKLVPQKTSAWDAAWLWRGNPLMRLLIHAMYYLLRWLSKRDHIFTGYSNSGLADDVLAEIPAWKHALDIGCIVITSPFWAPLMLVIAVIIKIISPGPVFFCQERIGYKGRAFNCFKFRSMKVNAETRSHEDHLKELMESQRPMTKLDNSGDPRLIPMGRLFRASGLDELPQLFNVLRREMSLVGPRPCTCYELQRYEPWQRERLNALPGLTGYWQVNGKNRTTFTEMVGMDISYIQNLSLARDLAIMFKTFPALAAQLRDTFARKRSS